MPEYSEITMTTQERQNYLAANRDKFSPERLLELTKRLNEDRASPNVKHHDAYLKYDRFRKSRPLTIGCL